mgnify:CR=1 FL=1
MRFTQVLCGTASAVVLAGLSAAGAAQAQETLTVDSIVVTAQKREQNLQDVPVVVTAIGAKLLQDTGVKDIKDLTILTPGLTVTSTTSEASTTARVRGVGTVGDNPGLESSVGVVIDGVYRSRNGVGFGDLGERHGIVEDHRPASGAWAATTPRRCSFRPAARARSSRQAGAMICTPIGSRPGRLTGAASTGSPT